MGGRRRTERQIVSVRIGFPIDDVAQYISLFANSGIPIDVIPTLSDQKLTEIGVTQKSDRIKIRRAMRVAASSVHGADRTLPARSLLLLVAVAFAAPCFLLHLLCA